MSTILNRTDCWLFIQSPVEMHDSIAFFMDYESLANARLVCKVWAKNLKNRLDQFSDTILPTLGYPLKAIQTLRKNGIELRNLKIVHLNKDKDYFSYLTENDLGSNAIVRVKDLLGRVGIAFYVRGKIEGQVDLCKMKIEIKKITGVVAFAQRDIDGKQWRVGISGGAQMMKTAADQIHGPSHLGDFWDPCPTCILTVSGGDEANYEFLNNLLSGEHPMLEITAPLVNQDQPQQ